MDNLYVIDKMTIKKNTNKAILQLLYRHKKLTKHDIARQLDVSIPTVTSNINKLIEKGLVKEAGVADSYMGRKPVIVETIPDSRYAFGVEISVKGVRIALTNLHSEIVLDRNVPFTEFNNIEKLGECIKHEVDEMLKIKNIDREKVLGLGLAVNGAVDEKKLWVGFAPNIQMRNVSFESFKDKFDMPFSIENEANTAALAEIILDPTTKAMRNLVYVSIKRGVRAGVIIHGKLYKGNNRLAGEFGHMTVSIDDRVCDCGKKGCWELYTSIYALLDYYNELSTQKLISYKDVLKKCEEGDPIAQKALDKYLDYLSLGLQNIILTVDPHYIVIGGELSEYGNLFIEKLNEKVFTQNHFFDRGDVNIFNSSLKDNATILGAALLHIQKVFLADEMLL